MPYLNQQPTNPAFVGRPVLGKADACCAPDTASETFPHEISRRAKLSDLDSHLHCSIIGTCLSTGELRKLVPRHDLSIDRKISSDLDIHHAAVNLSTTSERMAKELTKLLDARHAQAIKRFKTVTSETGMSTLWREAMASGDVPGAYWALMTHPSSTYKLRSLAFGDVHMLSHLVGASNRADIRRLAALDEECVHLRSQNIVQQGRLNELSMKHHQATTLVEEQAIQLKSMRERLSSLLEEDVSQQLKQAQTALAAQSEQIALLIQRYAEEKNKLNVSNQRIDELQIEKCGQHIKIVEAQAEVESLEQVLTQLIVPDSVAPALPGLRGLSIAYIGGRQQSTLILSKIVASAGGELLLHDGGVEDRKGLLASTLARAKLLVFPVDCVSHNAMHIAKQMAARAGIPCYPIRRASVAAFTELMHQITSGSQIERVVS